MVSYALGVDEHDYDRVRACFAPGFRARYGDHEFGDLDPLIEYISGVEHFVSTTHFMASQLIEVAGDEAAMRTAAIISQRDPPDGEPEWAIAGRRYTDRARPPRGPLALRRARRRTRRPSRARTLHTRHPTTRTFATCSTARRSRTSSRRSRSRSTGATSTSCAPASRPDAGEHAKSADRLAAGGAGAVAAQHPPARQPARRDRRRACERRDVRVRELPAGRRAGGRPTGATARRRYLDDLVRVGRPLAHRPTAHRGAVLPRPGGALQAPAEQLSRRGYSSA